MAAKKSTTHKISLALQGGGSHGAFAWGVLDRLLQEPWFSVEAISGTSAGAMNALVLAAGYAEGGSEGARAKLEAFWRKVSSAAKLLPLQPTFFDKFMGNTQLAMSPGLVAMDFLTKVFSPYQFNLFDIHPLKDILAELVDFKALQRSEDIALFLNATHVLSGRLRLFRNKEIDLESALAAACLPFLFKTAEVDEQPYWEGSFVANPSLMPLVEECEASDILLVQTTPMANPSIPTKAPDILDRAGEISANAALAQELRCIDLLNRFAGQGKISGEGIKQVHFHMIGAEEQLGNLGNASKLNADWDFLTFLRDLGRQATEDWLAQHKGSLGVRGTVDIKKAFLA